MTEGAGKDSRRCPVTLGYLMCCEAIVWYKAGILNVVSRQLGLALQDRHCLQFTEKDTGSWVSGQVAESQLNQNSCGSGPGPHTDCYWHLTSCASFASRVLVGARAAHNKRIQTQRMSFCLHTQSRQVPVYSFETWEHGGPVLVSPATSSIANPYTSPDTSWLANSTRPQSHLRI